MTPSSPSLPKGHLLVILLAALHLVMATRGMLHGRSRPSNTLFGRILQVYSVWTGASSRFNFFAPGINPSLRMSFDVAQDTGELLHDDLRFAQGAMDLRAYCMVLRFGLRKDSDELARAWAATMFGRHPDARSITVRLERLELPTMAQYRDGQRPTWAEVYRAGFEHHPRAQHASLEGP